MPRAASFRVLTLTWEFPPLIAGGLGMACYGLVRAMLEMGVQVVLVLPSRKPVFFELSDVSHADQLDPAILDPDLKRGYGMARFGNTLDRFRFLEVLCPPVAYSPGALTPGMYRSQIESILPHVDFDVIHAHDWLTYEAGLYGKGVTGKPLVCHVHSTEYDRACGAGDQRIHQVERMGLETADRVVTVSRFTADRVRDCYSIDPGRIRVVHNAYFMEYPEPSRGRLFREPVVLFMGRMTCQKGPDIFLEVARRVLIRHRMVRFLMAGEGDMMDRLVHRSAHSSLGNRVLFTGFLNREGVSRILAVSDILLAPSITDPFNITVLEAMSRGLVAVVSRRSGVTEVVRHILTADYWDVEDMAGMILSLLKNPGKRRRMGELAKQEAERIHWHDRALKMRELYGELVC